MHLLRSIQKSPGGQTPLAHPISAFDERWNVVREFALTSANGNGDTRNSESTLSGCSIDSCSAIDEPLDIPKKWQGGSLSASYVRVIRDVYRGLLG